MEGGDGWLRWVLGRGFWGRGEIRKGGVRTRQQPLIWRRWGFLGCKNAPLSLFLLLKCIFSQRPLRSPYLKKNALTIKRFSNYFFYTDISFLSITSLIIIYLSKSTCFIFSILSLITLSRRFSFTLNSSIISIL